MTSRDFTEVFRTPFFNVESTRDEYSNGAPYFRINSKDSVICCLINHEDDLLFARQLRPNLGYQTIEFPAGSVEDGETPICAAEREIKEELGFKSRLIFLGSYRLMMNRTVNKEHLYIGYALEGEVGATEDGISLVKIPRKELVSAIHNGKIEQLAALGIIKLIDIKFGLNFLFDNEVIDKIWG